VKPIEYDKNHLQGASSEIASASSALNMEPSPIENPDEDAMFLSELDQWANHSQEHLHQAMAEIRKAQQKLDEIQVETINLYKDEVNPKEIAKIILKLLSEV